MSEKKQTGFICQCGRWNDYPADGLTSVPIHYYCKCRRHYAYFHGVNVYLGETKTGGIHPRRSMPRASGEDKLRGEEA